MSNRKKDLDARIAVIGAGPAGLSTAWFLKKSGYNNVLVLEKLGRIGGLCKTITEDYQSYDLGANYVTFAYRETMKIAREMGARLYTEPPYTALEAPEDPREKARFKPFVKAVLVDDRTGKPFSLWLGLVDGLKYILLRWRLRSVIDKPTFAGVCDYDREDLCVPFAEWLKRHKLERLKRLFEIPITIMGYNQLSEIAAPYALKYMSLRTFIPMVMLGVPLIRRLVTYPKRFYLGFQRMWHQVAWRLNVRLNVDIRNITRTNEGVAITFIKREQILNRLREEEVVMTFDYLILACPLSPNVLCSFLDMSEEETDLFRPIKTNSYTMTTLTVENLNMPTPVAAVVPLTPTGTPWAVVQQWKEKGSLLTQFYTMADTDVDPEPVTPCAKGEGQNYEPEIYEAIKQLVSRMGGEIASPEEEWRTYDRWPYFQHVGPDEFRKGFYKKLERQQGKNRTYYVGGATNFELIEPIVRYSKNLVQTHFPRTPSHTS